VFTCTKLHIVIVVQATVQTNVSMFVVQLPLFFSITAANLSSANLVAFIHADTVVAHIRVSLHRVMVVQDTVHAIA
jgi:hypothetical protein